MLKESATPDFENLGGSADSDPGALKRWVSSMFMRRMSSLVRREKQRKRAEKIRQKHGDPHVIHYFHEMDDGYSLLTVQILEQFQSKYDVELHCHISSRDLSDNIPEPNLLNRLSITDGKLLAPHFNLLFPNTESVPEPEHVKNSLKAALKMASDRQFSDLAGLTTAVFSNSYEEINKFNNLSSEMDPKEIDDQISHSNNLRKELGHYSGAMFYYAGEWYWGVDRLYHLENRLMELGACKDKSERLLCPRPEIEMGPSQDSGNLKLRFFVSLRSPYTSIIYKKTKELAEKTGVQLEISPVLPMVMRGVPATMEKGKYIMSDTAREAKTLNIDWGGSVYDPIGKPVSKCYAIYPWASRQGRGEALLEQFINSAFFEGININSDSGFKKVVEAAGLNWTQAKSRLYLDEGQQLIEKNRQNMYALGCWGVPSYDLLDEEGNSLISTWGQDRLWLISRAIQNYLNSEALR
ncbi:DsbA family protein [Gammaproteobacteria bacterium]|nr:DsbA family protein [Gammaproteobacteria bacterium]